jgi:hypothetical protein
MAQKGGKDSQYRRLGLWTLASIAALASAAALYFAFKAHHEHLRTVVFAAELSAKERELVELREREGARSATAMKARVRPPPPVRRSARFDDSLAPLPSLATRLQSYPIRLPLGPEIREMNRQARLRILRPIYDILLTQLNLSPEQRDRFYDLQLVVDDPGEQIEEQIPEQIQQIRDSALSQIQDMLGPGEYQLYQSYLETQSERKLAEEFRQRFESSEIQINDSQSAQLRDALIQTSKQYPPVGGDFTASDQAALAQAAQFLTPEQLKSFQGFLREQESFREQKPKQSEEALPP